MDWTKADRERLTEWLSKAQGPLLRSVRKLGRTNRDAEDIIQDTVIAVIERWKELDSFEKFLAYCITRARWRALDARRKYARESLESQLSGEERETMFHHLDTYDANTEFLGHDLMRKIQHLSPRSRDVVLLSATGMTSFEIARRLQIEPSSVRSLLRHARYRLALEHLNGEEDR